MDNKKMKMIQKMASNLVSQNKLNSTDYKIIKCYEATLRKLISLDIISVEDLPYPDIIDEMDARQAHRDNINSPVDNS